MLQHSPADPFFCETSSTLYTVDSVCFFTSSTDSLPSSALSSRCSRGTAPLQNGIGGTQAGTAPLSSVTEISGAGLLCPGSWCRPLQWLCRDPHKTPMAELHLSKGCHLQLPSCLFTGKHPECPVSSGTYGSISWQARADAGRGTLLYSMAFN